jgi:hypothetical protein
MERRVMHQLFSLWNSIQQYLIPYIEESLSVLSAKEVEFVRIAELASVDKFIKEYKWRGNGRKPHYRKLIVLAFIAKAVWNLPTTRALMTFLEASRNVRTLCGWERAIEIPSEATFSRAFDQFARDQLPSRIHCAMVKAGFEGRIAGHSSMDSTEVEAREKAVEKPKKEKNVKPKERQKPGPKKGQKRREKRQPKRLELQLKRTLEENLSDLPNICDCGVKCNSKGFRHTWKGYKLHMTVADGGIPISTILTSASVHDSQVAIPLMQMSNERVTSLYDLADSAYDADLIKEYSYSLEHVPIIEPSKRNGKDYQLAPAERIRYRERSAVERAFSNLKDNYGGRFLRVKGAAKVMAHLMFGVLALTATQLFRLLE